MEVEELKELFCRFCNRKFLDETAFQFHEKWSHYAIRKTQYYAYEDLNSEFESKTSKVQLKQENENISTEAEEKEGTHFKIKDEEVESEITKIQYSLNQLSESSLWNGKSQKSKDEMFDCELASTSKTYYLPQATFYSSRIARRFWVLLPAKPHREREFGLCTSRQKSVCEVCRNIGESERECIRESIQKCGGQEKAGLPKDRKRKWCKVAKWMRKPSAVVGCVWGRVGNVAVCGIRPRHPIFFIIDRVVVHKGVCTLSLPSLSCVCACAHVVAPITPVCDLRALRCCVVLYMKCNFF
jgi:hypothetical protein